MGNGGGVAISVIGGRGLFADGTAAAPSISFASDTNTGFYSNAADSIGISVNGARQFRFEATGRLYGGTVNNFLGLDSSGAVSIGAAGTNQNITLTPSGTGGVGIGTTSPSQVLTLNTTSGSIASWKRAEVEFGIIGVGNGSFSGLSVTDFSVTGSGASGRLALGGRTGVNPPVLITTAGNVLVGTGLTDSGALLQIGTNTTDKTGGMVFGTDCFLYRDAVGTLALNGTGTNSYFSFLENGTAKGFVGTAGGDLYLATSTAKSVLLRTNSITALTLDSSQNATFTSRTFLPNGTANAPAYSFTNANSGGLYQSGGSIGIATAGVSAVLFDTSQRTILGGALRLANAYVAGAVVGTGYVTIQDSTGTTYRVPVLV